MGIPEEDWEPGWSPNWQDVQFDHAKAAAAAAALRATAKALDKVSRRRAAEAKTLLGSWKGGFRRGWETNLLALQQEAGLLYTSLVQMATSIDNAAAAARTEQGKRVRAREQWKGERDRLRKARANYYARQRTIAK